MEKARRRFGGAASVISGDAPASSSALLRHGLYWVLASIGLDFASSWLMMSLLGPNAEGNSNQRLIFEDPSPQTFLHWLIGQWA